LTPSILEMYKAWITDCVDDGAVYKVVRDVPIATPAFLNVLAI
jgi:hypothetical protein